MSDPGAAAGVRREEPESPPPNTRVPDTRVPDSQVHVPDGSSVVEALERTTALGIGAHPDDLEFFALAPIGECLRDPDRWFTGVVCTDGAGSATAGRFASLSASELVEVRHREQVQAAELGGYSAVVQLSLPSADVRGPEGHASLVELLADLIARCRPDEIHTHDLADLHETHVAVATAVVAAVRRLPADQRPRRMFGYAGWRTLDWLPESYRVDFDVSESAELATRLASVHESQLSAKRYDLAGQGRRRAAATFRSAREPDEAVEVVAAMDLTPLVHDDRIEPEAFLASAIDRFRAEVLDSLRRLGS